MLANIRPNPREVIRALVSSLAHSHMVGTISLQDLAERLELPPISKVTTHNLIPGTQKKAQEINRFAAIATERLLTLHGSDDIIAKARADQLLIDLHELFPTPKLGSILVTSQFQKIAWRLEQEVAEIPSKSMEIDGYVVVLTIATGGLKSASEKLDLVIKQEAIRMGAELAAMVSYAAHTRIGINHQQISINSWLENRSPWSIRLVEEGSGKSHERRLKQLEDSKALYLLDSLKELYNARELEILHLFHNPSALATFSPRIGNLLLRTLIWPWELQKNTRATLLDWEKSSIPFSGPSKNNGELLSTSHNRPESMISLALQQLDLIIGEAQEFKIRNYHDPIREVPTSELPLAALPPELAVRRILAVVAQSLPTEITEESKNQVLMTLQGQLFRDLQEDRTGLAAFMQPKIFSFCCECRNTHGQAVFVIVSPQAASLELAINAEINSLQFEDNIRAQIDCEVFSLPDGDPFRRLSLSSDLHKLLCKLTEQIWLRETSTTTFPTWQDSDLMWLEKEQVRDPLANQVLNSCSADVLRLVCSRYPYIEDVLEALGTESLITGFENYRNLSAPALILNLFHGIELIGKSLPQYGEHGVERISDWLAYYSVFDGKLSIGKFLESIPLWEQAARLRPAEPSILLFGGSEDLETLLEEPQICQLSGPLSRNLLLYGLTSHGAKNLEALLQEQLVQVDAVNADALKVLNTLSEDQIRNLIVRDVVRPLAKGIVPANWLAHESREDKFHIVRLRLSADCWTNWSN